MGTCEIVKLLKCVHLLELTQVLDCSKVRSLWSTIDGMLAATKEEQHAVESVLKGDVDQFVLDGTDKVLKIPRCLLERIEQLPNQVRVKITGQFILLNMTKHSQFKNVSFLIVHVFQLSSGNVYEAGQLNLLCVMELMNHALQLLREERCRVSHASKPQLSPKQLQEKCQQMARVLQNLHLIRYTMTQIPLIEGWTFSNPPTLSKRNQRGLLFLDFLKLAASFVFVLPKRISLFTKLQLFVV